MIDTHSLAKTGFTLIRGLLNGSIKGGAAVALELAEALHNLPEPGNDFLQEWTLKSVRKFTTKHPHLKAYLCESLPLD